MDRFFILRSFLLFSVCLFCLASQGQYYFDNLTEKNGLSDNRVTCFLKDKTGFLWVGTKNGLNRFDGNLFKIFKPTSSNSISNEIINDIVQDSTGKIWVATMAGLNIYDPETGSWETMMPVSDIENDLPNYIIWDLDIDEHNHIWIVSDAWELSVYNPVTKKFTYYDWPSFKQQKMFDGLSRYRSIQKIVRKNETEWWLATTIGLCSMNIQSGQFKFYGSGYTASVKDLKYDSHYNLVFLVIENGQLFCYDEKKKFYQQIKTNDQAHPATIWDKKINEKDLLLMPHPGGMLEINTASKKATMITYQAALPSSLLPGGTNSIYMDNTGMVWVGSGNGINYYNNRNCIADFIPLTTAVDKEGADGMSAAFYDTIDKRYYITSLYSKELFIIDDHTGKISSVKSVDGKAFSACTNICSDQQNNIWLLTETNVYKYDREKKKFSLFPTPNQGLKVVFHDLVEDNKGDYWLATWADGVYQYKVKENLFYKLTEKDGIYSKSITALKNDPFDDAVWMGSFNDGAYRYGLENKNTINYRETPANPDYRQLNLIRDIEADASGKLWIATIGAGLYVYQHGNPYEKSFSHITVKNGLRQSIYYSIAADNKNRLWLLSGNGLSAIDQSGKFLFEGRKHPLMVFANYATDMQYPKRIFFNKIKNELLVPVAGGLLFYYPDKKIPATAFPIAITDISVGGRSVIYDAAYLKKESTTIPSESNSLSFQFAALKFTDRENLQYEYKLRETDTEWKSPGNTTIINFPDLSSGRYTFMIRAKDAGGRLSANVFSFPFYIQPPFWKTWWFMMLLVLTTAYCFYRWTVFLRRKIKAQKILNYFATSLYGQNTVEDIFWDVARNCISQLKFADCVVYLYDHKREVLVQKAAYGPKNPEKYEIINAIEIPVGKGIVGTVAQTGKAEIIRNTSKDSRYIVDDERRYSEIAVPIFVDGKIFGVIDSEHPRKNFYRKYHLRILKDIAIVCSAKVSKYIIEERLRTKISRDLHDEIGSALTSINVLSKVALSKAGDNPEMTGYLSRIKDSTFNTMESMSDIVWAINPKNDKLDAIMSRMKEFVAGICEGQGIDLEFIWPAGLENISIDLAKRKNMFLIFKEAVNNAVKYSGCSLLQIKFERSGDVLMMTIKDNGKGFDTASAYRGNGLHNMRERAIECNGVLHIRSSLQQGTSIILEMNVSWFEPVVNS